MSENLRSCGQTVSGGRSRIMGGTNTDNGNKEEAVALK
jgi:hypothetical protein